VAWAAFLVGVGVGLGFPRLGAVMH